jgi:Acetyltransferase (GNAT) domain
VIVLEPKLTYPLMAYESVNHCVPNKKFPTNEPRTKKVYIIDPLQDPRWDVFLQLHPRASLFHSSGWLRALAVTYGYRPIAYTTCSPGESLCNAAVFCQVESWLTGRRLVSLPFSDHCEWLVDKREDARAICEALEQSIESEHWRYIELRPLSLGRMPFELSRSQVRYTFHALDLRPNLEVIFANFHKSSIQRKISRAKREGLTYCEGSSDLLLNHFYRLLRITRKRHRLPPQPRRWFANLIRYFGDGVKIRLALKNGRPVAAMLTVRYKDTMVYKYGCSDKAFNRLGSMHLLFWNAIQEAKEAGLRCFDFGRTDADQQGLITFKSRWGGVESVLDYSRYRTGASSLHLFDLSTGKWKANAAKFVLSHLPSGVVSRIGEALYGHVG